MPLCDCGRGHLRSSRDDHNSDRNRDRHESRHSHREDIPNNNNPKNTDNPSSIPSRPAPPPRSPPKKYTGDDNIIFPLWIKGEGRIPLSLDMECFVYMSSYFKIWTLNGNNHSIVMSSDLDLWPFDPKEQGTVLAVYGRGNQRFFNYGILCLFLIFYLH